ncbi:MAG: TRAP transporter large permease subunit [Desulfurococcales archaeon]|jgi:TRAP transporter 4TM/12TM fusion protein|nr:TRAP transporter large permease subunit [Desulfurococcales archaeon]
MGWSETLLLMGVILRHVGPEMSMIATIFLLYNIYANSFPYPWNHPGFSIDYLIGKIYVESEAALFGLVTGVSLKYVAYFTILSGVLGVLGYGDAMARTFLSRMGRRPGSVGRAAVFMGLGMGMISGSGAADTTFISTTMKPIFRKAGYDDLAAAGLSANAGTLAIITPPVLGSVAFIMAELLAIPYTTIVIMSIIPAVLYVISIYLYNEYYSRRAGLKHVEILQRESPKIHVFAPAMLIASMIFLGYSIPLSVTSAIILAIVIAAIDRDLRPRLRNILTGFAEGFIPMASVGSSIAMANFIMAMVVISGLSQKFTLALLSMVQNNLLAAILFAWGFSLLLGIGIPPSATYVLSSLLTAPAIINLATSIGIPQDTATLAVHMFLFYMAMLADITPPVALSAFAASAVFGLDPIKTGVKAATVAIPKHLYAISFVYSYWGASLLIIPVLLHSPPIQAALLTISRVAASIAGIWFLTLANVGFYRSPIPLPLRMLLGVSGTAMMIPSEVVNTFALLIGIISVAVLNRLAKKTLVARS